MLVPGGNRWHGIACRQGRGMGDETNPGGEYKAEQTIQTNSVNDWPPIIHGS